MSEEGMNRLQAELKTIYDHAPVMMCLVDEDRTILFANAAFRKFAIHTGKEVTGSRPADSFGCINATDDPRGCGYGKTCAQCSIRLAMDDGFKTGASHHDIEYHTTLLQNGVYTDVTMTGSTSPVPATGSNQLLLCLHDITQQKKAENELRRVNRLYLIQSRINHIIVRAKDQASLFKNLCRTVRETGNFRMVWIGLIDWQTGQVEPVEHAGQEGDYLTKISISSNIDSPFGRGPTGEAIHTGKAVTCGKLMTTTDILPCRVKARKMGYLSSASVPSILKEKV